MNGFRLILLGIGLLIIAGIYLHGTVSRKRRIRSRVEKIPILENDNIPNISFNHDDENNNFSDASGGADQNASAPKKNDAEPLNETQQDKQNEAVVREVKEELLRTATKEELIILYIMAEKGHSFKGKKILYAMESVDMEFGPMDIFHHYGTDEMKSEKPLFSLLNIVEPGHFNINQMEGFTSNGLAIFMRLPVNNNGGKAFDIMLDKAWEIARILNGELHDSKHNFLDPSTVNTMRDKAALS